MASAQTYPARLVRLVVGFAPGGGTDIAGRLTGQWLSARLGQAFIVENRPGAGSSTAADVVAHAAPDGSWSSGSQTPSMRRSTQSSPSASPGISSLSRAF
jgi:tripartite-type tricarboxylate transporter receptor subunit TctC